MNNPWIYILIAVGIILAVAVIVGLLIALFVTLTSGGFSKKITDKYIGKITEILPGENCGECGCETCGQFARCAFYGDKPEDGCTRGSETLGQDIKNIMGEFFKMIDDPTPPGKGWLKSHRAPKKDE